MNPRTHRTGPTAHRGPAAGHRGSRSAAAPIVVLALAFAALVFLPVGGAAQQASHDHAGPDAADHAHGAAPDPAPDADSDATPEAAGAAAAPASHTPLAAPLEALGQAAFAAIQEIVDALDAQPDTDWTRVDLEALRRHLVDMDRFTLEAEVVEREAIPGGLRVTVRGTTPEADASIRRALHAHAPMLEAESGWTATVEDASDGTALEVIARDEADAARIRGLGYIGLMATGAHHQAHHWAIANGEEPHGH